MISRIILRKHENRKQIQKEEEEKHENRKQIQKEEKENIITESKDRRKRKKT